MIYSCRKEVEDSTSHLVRASKVNMNSEVIIRSLLCRWKLFYLLFIVFKIIGGVYQLAKNVNEQIRDRESIVIDSKRGQLGIMSSRDAQKLQMNTNWI